MDVPRRPRLHLPLCSGPRSSIPSKYPFIIMLADTRGQASINAASVQHELRNNDLILKDYGHLKYNRIDDPRPEPTLESDEDWQAMNCVLDNGVRILSRSRGQKVRGVKHRQHRPSLVVGDDVEDLDWRRGFASPRCLCEPAQAARPLG